MSGEIPLPALCGKLNSMWRDWLWTVVRKTENIVKVGYNMKGVVVRLTIS
jgi:hypothetical protein